MDNAPIVGESSPGFAPGYPAMSQSQAYQGGHMDSLGTLDLSKRQVVSNPEPTHTPDEQKYEYGSEYSARSKLHDGRQMTYPTIYDGKQHAPPEALQHALQTGQHMGIFKAGTPERVMEDYENQLHGRPIRVNGQLLNGDTWKAMQEKR